MQPKLPGMKHSERSAPSAHPARDSCLIGVTSLVANRVYDGRGKLVGKLAEIVIDSRTGCIRHAVLVVGGVLGFGRKRLAVPWSALSPHADYRKCTVNLTQMMLTAVEIPADDPWLQRGKATPARESDARRGNAVGAKLTW